MPARPGPPGSPGSTAPSIRFLFIGPTSSLNASSPRSVTLPQLRFASFTLACSREDFHLWMDAHAGRTNETSRSRDATGPEESVVMGYRAVTENSPLWRWLMLAAAPPSAR